MPDVDNTIISNSRKYEKKYFTHKGWYFKYLKKGQLIVFGRVD